MDIKRMHDMIEKLSECAKSEFDGGIENVDTCEMGKVTDMLKDLAEAMYYRTLTKAMDESEDDEIMEMFDRYGDDRRYYDHYRYKSGRFAPKGKGTYRRGYEEPPYWHMIPQGYQMSPDDYKSHSPEYWRDMDKSSGKMYYTEPMRNEGDYPHDLKDGRSWKTRRGYMESKELHKANTPEDKQANMKSLEAYMRELGEDVAELVNDMSSEEKSLLKQRMQVIMQKIQ